MTSERRPEPARAGIALGGPLGGRHSRNGWRILTLDVAAVFLLPALYALSQVASWPFLLVWIAVTPVLHSLWIRWSWPRMRKGELHWRGDVWKVHAPARAFVYDPRWSGLDVMSEGVEVRLGGFSHRAAHAVAEAIERGEDVAPRPELGWAFWITWSAFLAVAVYGMMDVRSSGMAFVAAGAAALLPMFFSMIPLQSDARTVEVGPDADEAAWMPITSSEWLVGDRALGRAWVTYVASTSLGFSFFPDTAVFLLGMLASVLCFLLWRLTSNLHPERSAEERGWAAVRRSGQHGPLYTMTYDNAVGLYWAQPEPVFLLSMVWPLGVAALFALSGMATAPQLLGAVAVAVLPTAYMRERRRRRPRMLAVEGRSGFVAHRGVHHTFARADVHLRAGRLCFWLELRDGRRFRFLAWHPKHVVEALRTHFPEESWEADPVFERLRGQIRSTARRSM